MIPTKPSRSRSRSAQANHRQPQILAVGVESPFEHENILHVQRADDALKLLRQRRFDLVLVSTSIQNLNAWLVAGAICRYWPWQRWVLIAGRDLTDDEQRLAYEMRASGIFDAIPDMGELVRKTGN
jgi:hypothetical protein